MTSRSVSGDRRQKVVLGRFSIKELFFDDLAILDVEDPNFFECKAWLAFECDVLLQQGTEKFARDDRFAAGITMPGFDHGPARDSFGFDCFQAIG